jgi:hypothetical protein
MPNQKEEEYLNTSGFFLGVGTQANVDQGELLQVNTI